MAHLLGPAGTSGSSIDRLPEQTAENKSAFGFSVTATKSQTSTNKIL